MTISLQTHTKTPPISNLVTKNLPSGSSPIQRFAQQQNLKPFGNRLWKLQTNAHNFSFFSHEAKLEFREFICAPLWCAKECF
jgi:hypothetical protein